ncbi:hypothetical protein CSW37_01575 [Thermus scotoductus]|jgi:hypothetical protein|uniref:Antitoxin n=1 Tax=Thermus scotoductus TaxID=37636 RepID=A0A430R187_THESC|nr:MULTISPECIES: hypothetical protein [Thermus]ETN88393.1 hypothetical protein TNMX_07415 [Thermus sp. NMX2.A1]RTG91543.1 hypothetical protein CSW51_13790 [Thermus scotoductus]RTG93762.1 hypothetical protein CSW49_10000 [Thermus scotoductus]RTG93889.1 hypothetical protein CSW48_09990 [Thermus scotoductus]RTH01161.1 hypothetical protein CSW45_11080 [Thermus scotoductus]
MRTTLDLPDPLYRHLKLQAAKEGKTLRELVIRYLEEGLRRQAQRQPRPLPKIPPAGRQIPSWTGTELWELLEDGPPGP